MWVNSHCGKHGSSFLLKSKHDSVEETESLLIPSWTNWPELWNDCQDWWDPASCPFSSAADHPFSLSEMFALYRVGASPAGTAERQSPSLGKLNELERANMYKGCHLATM